MFLRYTIVTPWKESGWNEDEPGVRYWETDLAQYEGSFAVVSLLQMEEIALASSEFPNRRSIQTKNAIEAFKH